MTDTTRMSELDGHEATSEELEAAADALLAEDAGLALDEELPKKGKKFIIIFWISVKKTI